MAMSGTDSSLRVDLPRVDGDYMLEQTAALCRIPSPTGFTRAAVDHVAES